MADVAAHRRLRDRNARLIEESLAMLGQGQVGVALQLRRQPLPQGLALRRGPTAGIFIVSTPPVWRLLLSQRLMVEGETPKRSCTCALGMPRSIAASVFNLRSFE
jgi:hypothetical protein